ncbi:hypothetical protein LTR36_007446 [Oleoguttula mirabilis]|uniref:RRM domain-containing protein n=1 Tax=Oleoguttula mirabilis TaxID=1507867 RepID=A0AAV9JAF2_9PEZI|nr:hypothetical protein LTR36_007446 [Oleoguttula mirabilis]
MQSIKQVARLNDVELEKVVPSNASWHTDYRDTAYIYIGGLPFELSEGDILTMFSQYGNPVHINLVRDKETGKSKGFAFLKYEDQRSCDLAVDNLSGAGVMGRMVSVDHTRYKRKEGEVEAIGDEQDDDGGDVTDKEGAARSKRRKTGSEDESEEEQRPMIKAEIELAKLRKDMDDDDPMKAYMIKEKQAEVEEALKAVVTRKSRDKERESKHRHRHHRSRKDGSGEEDDVRRDGHRSRRHRSVAEEDGRPRRSHKSRRERTATPEIEEDTARRRHRSRKADSDEDERRRKRPDEDRRPERERSASDRSRSRERHRRR